MSNTYVIVHLSNLSVNTYYQADAPNYGMFGGENGSPQASAHLPVPEGLTWDTVMATRDDSGEIVLLEDPAKVAQKTQAQWTSVRAQQKQKLYESDWTCSVIDPPPEILAARDAWLQYRAQLRDVTTQTDPFNIIWPLRPTA
jgi:hypothetical protein